MSRPSGIHAGRSPALVIRRTGPPLAPTVKSPPSAPSERKTRRRPSGDHAGWVSLAGVLVMRVGSRPCDALREDVEVAVPVPGERDPPPVRRPRGIGLQPGAEGEPRRIVRRRGGGLDERRLRLSPVVHGDQRGEREGRDQRGHQGEPSPRAHGRESAFGGARSTCRLRCGHGRFRAPFMRRWGFATRPRRRDDSRGEAPSRCSAACRRSRRARPAAA